MSRHRRLPFLGLLALVGCATEGTVVCDDLWFVDADGDGWGSGQAVDDCTGRTGLVERTGDCDDGSAATHPGAAEVCNGRDDDCDGVVDGGVLSTFYVDADADGYGAEPVRACSRPAGTVATAGDCDDQNARVHPGAPEACDGRDDDCDGVADDGVPMGTWYPDQDGDGFGEDDAGVSACEGPPGAVAVGGDCDDARDDVRPDAEERCDGVDNDCDGTTDIGAVDGTTWYPDIDDDGYGNEALGVSRCEPPSAEHIDVGGDCADGDPDRHPGVPELCNSVDDDCDGAIDEYPIDGDLWYLDHDLDGWGDPAQPVTACGPQGAGYSSAPTDCDDTDPDVFPGAAERPADGTDQDCDGLEACHLDRDLDGFGGRDLIQSLDLDCDDVLESWTDDDCDDSDDEVAPDLVEVPYDGRDNDCDPATRDDDLDDDRFPGFADCDDTDPDINPLEPTRFVDDTAASGLAAIQWDPSLFPASCAEARVAGIAAGDFDDDGVIDLYVPRIGSGDRLLRGLGDGRFADVSSTWGLVDFGTSSAALFVDVDGDDDLDLWVASVGDEPHRLYIQNGGRLIDEAAARGVDDDPGGACSDVVGLAAGDVDGDGDLDLLSVGWHPPGEPSGRTTLFLNDGTGRFERGDLDTADVAATAASLTDLDDDGFLDLALVAEAGGSGVWRGDGSGALVFDPDTVVDVEDGHGGVVADLDDDGDLDWFITGVYDPACPGGWGCSGNRAYLHDGGALADATDALGLRDGGWAWGAAALDHDHDGLLDLVVASGFTETGFDTSLVLHHNLGGGLYDAVTCAAGFDAPRQPRAVLPVDADDDGDLDLVVTHNAHYAAFYRNVQALDGNWLRLRLRDTTTPNTRGIGARVRVTVRGTGATWMRRVAADATHGSSGPSEVHVGLGDLAGGRVDVAITWPDGETTVTSDVATDQILTLIR